MSLIFSSLEFAGVNSAMKNITPTKKIITLVFGLLLLSLITSPTAQAKLGNPPPEDPTRKGEIFPSVVRPIPIFPPRYRSFRRLPLQIRNRSIPLELPAPIDARPKDPLFTAIHVYFKDRQPVLAAIQTEVFPDSCAQLIPENEVHQFPGIPFPRTTYYRSIGTDVKGWTMYVKSAGWPIDDIFMPSTTLIFIDDKNRSDLPEVSRKIVETCGDKSFPVNKTERDQYGCFILNEDKSSYYRSSRDRCLQDRRVAINVQGSHMNTPPPLPPQFEYSSAGTSTLNVIFTLFLMMILWAGIFH